MKSFTTPTDDASSARATLLEKLLKKKGISTAQTQAISRRPPCDTCPLSFAQQRIWFLERLEPGTATYNFPLAMRLYGRLSVPALKQAFGEVVRRHDVLRTTFTLVEGQPVQVVGRAMPFDLPVVDLTQVGQGDREAVALRLANEEASVPFDLERGLLLRACVLKLEDEDHVLLVTMHHIVTDGWSMRILTREISALYDAFAHGRPSPLNELPIQYSDFAYWQREFLKGDVLDSEVSYWKQQLSGPLPLLDLPTDRPRPKVQTFNGERQSLPISKEISDAIKSLGREEESSLYMVLLSAFLTLLRRYTGQHDIILGTPVAGRSHTETEGLVGFFVNTLVLRADVSGNPSFRELLARTRSVVTEAQGHQDLPFEMLVDAIQPERSLSHPPVFQVLFSFEAAEESEQELPGLKVGALRIRSKISKFDLTFSATESKEGITIGAEYNTDLFNHVTMTCLLTHYVELLKSIAANPDQPLARLDYLSQSELIQLISDFNPTFSPLPDDACLHHLFERQADASPLLTALQSGPDTLSYLKLDQTANRLAHQLQTLGVGPDVLVAICLPASIDLIASMLATLKAGGAYAPLDPSNPYTRLSALLDDISPPVLVTNSELAEEMPAGPWQVICLDTGRGLIDREASRRPDCLARADNLAYVMHTSGSTGRPKGVMVTHRGLVNYVSWAAAAYGLREGSVVPMHTRASFDLTVTSLYPALVSGGSVEVIEEWEGVEWVKGRLVRGYELVKLTPTHLEMIGALVKRQDASGWARRLVVGGEALRGETVRQWRERAPATRVINEYGPTETVVGSVAHEVGEAEEMSEGVAIGRPIANTEVYVLDEEMRMVARGVKGEIYIGGEGLARGYLNRAGETAERFVPDSYSGRAGARLYRSGDIGRHDEGGRLEYLGRRDEQVKVRGYRIEMVEVEEAMGRSRGVEQRAAVVKGEGERKRIVGYVTGAEWLRGEEVRESVKKEMPEYMVPVEVVVMKEMPVTRNGKVDRRKLEERGEYAGRGRRAEEVVGARTATEEALVDIWKQVLGIEQVGIDNNFFSLGGDSIHSVQVLSLAQDRGIEFSLQHLFNHQTIRELAQAIKVNSAGSQPTSVTKPFELILKADRLKLPDGVEDAYPLTMLQTGMLFHAEYRSDLAIYHNVTSVHLRMPFNEEAFRAAVRALLDRHSVLRTSFDLTSFSESLQLVHSSVDLPVEVEDLRHLGPNDQEQIISEWVEAERKRYFDWTRPPLLRFHIHWRDDGFFQFSLTEHHAILDGWSVASMLTELFDRYLSYANGETYDEPPPAAAFRDYVEMEREALASEECRRYWHEKLEGKSVIRVPRWPSHFRAAWAGRVIVKQVPIPHEVSDGLKNLAQSSGVPVKSVLLAAHLKVMSLIGGGDVLTGIASHGRSEGKGGEKVLGLFLNTAPFRMTLNDGTWRELAEETFKSEQELFPFRHYPMAQVQNELGGKSLFETAFNFTHFHVFQSSRHQDELKVLNWEAFARTDLPLWASFSIIMDSPQINLVLTGDGDELCEEQINNLCGYYSKALAIMAAEPESLHKQVGLLSAPELAQLSRWNATATEYPGNQCVHRLFETVAHQAPDSIAVSFLDQQLSYREVNRRANQLARHLQRIGVWPETTVGLLMDRSFDAVIAALAVLKAGGAYVPLDSDYPPERIAVMIEDAKARLVIADQRLPSTLLPPGVVTLFIDGERDAIDRESEENPVSGATADNLAYIMYTSGSTGGPKAVGITHRNIVRLVRDTNYVDLSSDDVFLLLAPMTFDASTFELWGSLLNGAHLVVMPGQIPTPEEIGRAISDYKVTTLWLTAGLFHLMVDERAEDLKPLRRLLAGGDVLSVPHVQKALAKMPDGVLINGYGPTENTTFTCCHKISDDRDLGGSVPIGRPISNTEVYVLQSDMVPVPIGVAGEIYAGSDGLARGYINSVELTAEKFVPKPFGREAGQRLYRTGDLGRYLPDGTVEFLGRADNQVKVRGFRIELQEIEAALAGHPSVRQCVIVARQQELASKQLVAYVVGAGDKQPDASDLRGFLNENLPAHMIPSMFVMMDEMPLTANGKIDRRSLSDPTPAISSHEGEYATSEKPIEEVLSAIWASRLGLDRIGLDEGFFDLGGHSLLAIQIISRVREAFSVNLSLKELFEKPTVRQMASSIAEASLGSQRAAGLLHIRKASRDARLPLSYAQQRLWFLDQLEPGSPSYNISIGVRISGRLNVEALQEGLNRVISRHEALRTSFVSVDGEPYQVIADSLIVTVPVIRLRGMSESDHEEEVAKLAAEEARREFDLSRLPLVRAKLVQLGREEHVMLMTMHHIVSDGWSMKTLISEMSECYEAITGGRAARLKDLPIQYADYAVWQREWMGGEVPQEQMRYWRNQLDGAPAVLELPTDRPRRAEPSYRGKTQGIRLSAEVTDKIRKLSREEMATLYMTMLAGFDALLYRYSGQEDLMVGSPIAGRSREEVEGLIGFFVNTLVLRVRPYGGMSYRELLGKVRGVCLEAYTHQDVPFEMLVEQMEPERSLTHTPLFQVMFILERGIDRGKEVAGLKLSNIKGGLEVAKFDLSMAVVESDDGMGVWLNYREELFEDETIRRMLTHFVNLMRDVAEDADRRIDDLQLLSKEERAQLLVEWNDTARDYDLNSSIPELFEAQVERTPDEISVVFKGQSLCYRELNRRANQLAHLLISKGVGPESRVGVCALRSLDMVVALLAILKAGAAYVPLNPQYPPHRLAFMIDDARVRLLLTQHHLLESLPAGKAEIFCVDSGAEAFAKLSPQNIEARLEPDNLAYVIYTSGSTGKPKGVMISHRGICNRLMWMQEAYCLTRSDVVLQKTSFGFDVSVWEFFWPLIAGARLVMAEPDGHKDTSYLSRVIQSEAVTTMHFVPAMLEAFLEQEGASKCESLRRVICSGEALGVELERKYHRVMGGELENLYGPTEASVDVTYWHCERRDERGIVPIGRPIANTQMYILDKRKQPVAVGVVGELHIAGVGLGRGYEGRAGLTAERFIPNPYGGEGERMYETGDLGRYLPDGSIEFLGRADNQVKVRGFRIELQEIEHVLRQHPLIKEAVVCAKDEGAVGNRLVGYLLSDEQNGLGTSEIRNYLKGYLPDYMVPSQFALLEKYPLTPNGKIDRRALSELEQADRPLKNTSPPRDLMELRLTQLWEELLQTRPINIKDNFFDLGGHSMLVVRLVVLIKKRFGYDLPVSAIFQGATVESLARLLRRETDHSAESPLVQLQPLGSRQPFFCVHPAGGTVFCYTELARHLGTDRPFYGLQSPRLYGGVNPHERVEDMAAEYINAVQAIQPRGPYLLGGWSFGGVVAFEMAQQLNRQNQEVARLVLFDTAAPRAKGGEPQAEMDDASLLVELATAQNLLVSREELEKVAPDLQLEYVTGLAVAAGVLPADVQADQVRNVLKVVKASVNALGSYAPQAYAGPVTLFRAAGESFDAAEEKSGGDDFGWNRISLNPVQVCAVAGAHHSMMTDPFVKALSEELRSCLDKAGAKVKSI